VNIGATTPRCSRLPAIRALPHWFADAIVKSLSGIALGLFLAFAVLPFVRWLFPDFEDWSIDRGMRIAEMLHPVGPNRTERALGVHGYVFVDVDTGDDVPQGASQQACDSVSQNSAPRWDCAAWRPINRYLLASIVESLRSWGAKLVVVDVQLGAGGYPLPSEEASALIAVLQGGGTPAIAVLPVRPLPDTLAGDELSIESRAIPGLTASEALALAAPALPYPGDILRRYVTCYGIQTAQAHEFVASIATRAEALLKGIAASGLCEEHRQMPQSGTQRIAFTLPEVPAEPSNGTASRDISLWNRYHLFLDRCRAIDLDAADASCSQSGLFRDKIAIIGTSSRARGDRHLTPLGEMSGSMVVLNAIRSRLEDKTATGTSVFKDFGHDLAVCGRAACVWFVAFVLLAMIKQKHFGPLVASGLRLIVVVGALTGVLWVGIKGSFSVAGTPQNLNLMFPLLAFGLEMYTTAARHLEIFIERPINRWIGRAEHRTHP
jgi:CHASE2 domain-containing sensor protein